MQFPVWGAGQRGICKAAEAAAILYCTIVYYTSTSTSTSTSNNNNNNDNNNGNCNHNNSHCNNRVYYTIL